MTQWHTKSKRKKTGGNRTAVRRCDKLLAWRGGDAAATIVSIDGSGDDNDDDERRKSKVVKGSVIKVKQYRAKFATVMEKGKKKAMKAEILSVEENTANRLFTRRNIITKGATIKINLDGKEQTAKVTSRPGQDGIVQAILE